MTTSGTYNFFPSNGDFVIEAFERIQVRPTSLTIDHLQSAYMSFNLAQQTWANRGVNLWTIDLYSTPLIAGQSTYALPANTVMVRDCYISTVYGGITNDQLIYPLSRNDYAAIPAKESQGEVNSFWYNRQTPQPLMVLWLVPNASTGSLKIYRNIQIQDANLANGETANIPYRFLEACCADLAARLAQKFAPQLWAQMKVDAQMAWKEAADEDSERVPFYMAPSMEGYWN